MRTRQLTVANAGAIERETPARAPDFRADVLVPLAQAAISGLIAGGLWAGGAAKLGADFWTVFSASVAIFGGAAWFILLRDHRRSLWTTERRLPTEAEEVPPAPRRPDYVIMDAGKGAEDNRRRQADAEIARVIDFITVAGLGTTSVKAMADHGFTRSEVEALRGVLFGVGVADWKPGGKAEGWGLTMPTEDAIDAWMGYRFD